MKSIEKYICEFCNTEYKNKIDCQDCETFHIKPKKIKKAKYESYKRDNCRFPEKINIEMEDGSVIEYTRKLRYGA